MISTLTYTLIEFASFIFGQFRDDANDAWWCKIWIPLTFLMHLDIKFNRFGIIEIELWIMPY
jgi:hypothetical protein